MVSVSIIPQNRFYALRRQGLRNNNNSLCLTGISNPFVDLIFIYISTGILIELTEGAGEG
jgi:hypothetical protein